MTSQSSCFHQPGAWYGRLGLALLLALILSVGIGQPLRAATLGKQAVILPSRANKTALSGRNRPTGITAVLQLSPTNTILTSTVLTSVVVSPPAVAPATSTPTVGAEWHFFQPLSRQGGELAGAAVGNPHASLLILLCVLVVVGSGAIWRGSLRQGRGQVQAVSPRTLAEPELFKSAGYHAYLVRLWRENTHTPWRASAQCARTGQKSYFVSLPELYAFLDAQTIIPPADQTPAGKAQQGDKQPGSAQQ